MKPRKLKTVRKPDVGSVSERNRRRSEATLTAENRRKIALYLRYLAHVVEYGP